MGLHGSLVISLKSPAGTRVRLENSGTDIEIKLSWKREKKRRRWKSNPWTVIIANVVRLTLLYIISEAVIPAPYQVRDKLQRESISETVDSPVLSTGKA
jgi:hypothetical protein